MAVVVDKPFALSADDARDVIAAAETAGVALSVYQNRRWDSDLLTLQQLLAQGRLGEVQRFESAFERFATESGPPRSRRRGPARLRQPPGRPGAAAVRRRPTSVYAEMRRTGGRRRRASSSPCSMRAACAPTSAATGGRARLAPRLRVSGTEGSYVVPAMDSQERHLIEGRSPATDSGRLGRRGEADWGWIQRGDAREPVPSERGRWDTYYPAFAAAVRGEREVPVDPTDAVLALEVIEAAERSAAAGSRRHASERPDYAAGRPRPPGRPRGAGRASRRTARRRRSRRSRSGGCRRGRRGRRTGRPPRPGRAASAAG